MENRMKQIVKRMEGGKNVEGNNIRKHINVLRKLNEQHVDLGRNLKNINDQKREEEKFKDFFDDLNVNVEFIEIEIYENLIFWGGTIDGVIQFVYKVTPEDATTGVEFDYLENFSPDNPENEEITGRIKSYFNTFYKYWRDNVINPNKDGEKPTIKLKPDTDQELKSAAE